MHNVFRQSNNQSKKYKFQCKQKGGLMYEVFSCWSSLTYNCLFLRNHQVFWPWLFRCHPDGEAQSHVHSWKKRVSSATGSKSSWHICRFCKALSTNKQLLENFDQSCKVLRRSGKHAQAYVSSDLKKLVHELLKQEALKKIPGRKYETYLNIKCSLLEDLDVHYMYKWIQEHKDFVLQHKAGR